jgi:membrane protease YdiL (CAAX protease family)
LSLRIARPDHANASAPSFNADARPADGACHPTIVPGQISMLRRIKHRLSRSLDELRDALEAVERRSLAEQARRGGRFDGEVVGVIVVACMMLIGLEYFGGSSNWNWLADLGGWFAPIYEQTVRYIFSESEYDRLFRLGYWAVGTFVGYMLIPMIWARFAMRRQLTDMGLRTKGTLSHLWIYVLIYFAILPIVYLVSGTQSFQNTYPFYPHAGRSWYDFLVWEGLYALQFLSLEFFFRGFLIHGLKRRFGVYSILISVIPYCMIHFGKPLPETIGSIIAGLVLGLFSLLTGNIWLGVLIHISVAVTMDVFAM